MKHKIRLLEVKQPIGYFYVGIISSDILSKITRIDTRRIIGNNSIGTQRQLDSRRVKDISNYCDDPDATFPTPFVLAIQSEDVSIDDSNEDIIISFSDDRQFAEVIDGQHRIEGIKANPHFKADLIVVIMMDMTAEEKAYVFSTINYNQKTVDKSLIYDLFDVSTHRSPFKTCHEIARTMNSMDDSPFKCRLKMLGKKAGENETLSQGAFVTHLLTLISDSPTKDAIDIKNGTALKENENKIFRQYFISDKDYIILKILLNYFSAIAQVFENEWTRDGIFTKTTGYGGFIKSLPGYYRNGLKEQNLSKEYFLKQMRKAKAYIQRNNIHFDIKTFGSSESAQQKFSEIFIPR